METFKRNKKLLIIFAVLLLIGGVFAFVNRNPNAATDKVVVEPTAEETVITGAFTCLPMKNGVPSTDESCVMGLGSDDGKMYALDSSQATIVSSTIGVKDRVRIVGVLTIPDTTVDEGNAFKIDGVMKVRAIQPADVVEGK
jgi:hypothetical protein